VSDRTLAERQPAGQRGLALITGASGGIGEHLARRFAAGGFDLVLVARREDRLKDLGDELAQAHGVTVCAVAADLAEPDAARAVFERVEGMGLEVDALVNNAGFAVSGPFSEAPERAVLDLLEVNVTSLVQLTKLVLPGMLSRRRGRVLNVASVAACMPGPLLAAYYASKAFVLSFSEALAVEVAGSGVTVTALCPGSTATGFADAAGVQGAALFRSGAMDAATVARAGYDGAMAGRRVVIPGLMNRVRVLAARLAPRRVSAALALRLNRTPG
jgi:short-subunit dehydrogenase